MRMNLSMVAAVAVGFCLFACAGPAQAEINSSDTSSSVASAGESIAPRKLVAPPGVVIQQNVAYLPSDRSEKLDLYLPDNRRADTSSPAVLIIHGGGWVGGDKSGRREFVTGTALAAAGYVCASVEYMKDAGKRWPTNLLDCKNAVRYLRANAGRLQINPEKIGVIGGSAGGHLALMVAYTSDVAELEPTAPYPGVSDAVSACVDMYGITDIAARRKVDKLGNPTGERFTSSALFAQPAAAAPEKYKAASPVTYVKASSPPTLILQGLADTTVDYEQSRKLDKLLTEKGVEHQLVELPGVGHAFALNDPKLPRDLRPEVVAFFDGHLRKTASPVSRVPRQKN
jgi:acetyl esterase/lipase